MVCCVYNYITIRMKNTFTKYLLAILCCALFTVHASALTCVNITKSISKNAKNTDVFKLQQFLYDKGYLSASPTGFFGVATLRAVNQFQADYKISPTGSIGPKTRSKIQELSCKINVLSTGGIIPIPMLGISANEDTVTTVVATPSIQVSYISSRKIIFSYAGLPESTVDIVSEKTGKVVYDGGPVRDTNGSLQVEFRRTTIGDEAPENGYYYARITSTASSPSIIAQSERFYYQSTLDNPVTITYPVNGVTVKNGQMFTVNYTVQKNQIDNEPLLIAVNIAGNNSVTGGGEATTTIGLHTFDWQPLETGMYRPLVLVKYRGVSYSYLADGFMIVGN